MRTHSIIKIQKIKDLRETGYSINEIVSALNVPKTTVWHHLKGIKVKEEFLSALKSKRGGSKKRRLKAVEKSLFEAKEILNNKKIYASILSMLYWAEGNKESCVFTNTDPQMIRVFINTMNKCFNINKDRYTLTIRYFTGMSQDLCLKYWSDQLEINKECVKMYYNDGCKRGKSPYGMCRLTVKRGGYVLKLLKSMIFLVAAEIDGISISPYRSTDRTRVS